MANPHPIQVTVNGETRRFEVAPRTTLAELLREVIGLKGTHLGCEHGVCGACTVELDGRTVRSCLTLAVQADGRNVQTIEGASQSGAIRDLQEAFVRRNALQCGFCTPGMLMSAKELVEQRSEASRAEVREAISGNYCRCTGYHAIVDVILEVMAQRKAQAVLPTEA